MAEPVSWSVSPADSPRLRRVTYAVLGLLGGVVGLVGGILVWLALGRLADGDARLLVLLVVLGSVGGLYLRAALRDRRLSTFRVDRLDRRWLAAASLAGAAALWVLAAVSTLAALAAVALDAAALVGLLAVARNEGAVDPDTRRLASRDREVDLGAVVEVDAYAVGPATLLRLSYAAGETGPRFVVVPTEVAPVVREVAGQEGE